MRPVGVIFSASDFYEHRVFQVREDFAVEQFAPHPAVKRLDVTVLPRAAWLNEERLYDKLEQPFTHFLCRKLRPVVGAYVIRDAEGLQSSTSDGIR